jgi:hypothetical protein
MHRGCTYSRFDAELVNFARHGHFGRKRASWTLKRIHWFS